MRILTLEALRRLAAEHEPPCISIYAPTHRNHVGAAQDRIRYKNLVARAERMLEESFPAREARRLVAPLQELSTVDFWNRQLDGLAVFAADGFRADYQLRMSVSEMLVVADSFHLRPLLRYMQSNERYFLLAVSQNHVAFYKGDSTRLSPYTVEGLPKSLLDALGPEVTERFLNFRSNVSAQGTGAHFHGHGAGKQTPEEDLLRYFRLVDAALWKELREEKATLVLAAPMEYHTLYRSVARYPYLAEEAINGNFERAKPDEVHERAWPIVQRQVEARVGEVLRAYGNLEPRGRATRDLERIAQGALAGRVMELLVAEGTHLWGVLDRTTGAVELRGEQGDTHDDDVIDDIAEAVLLRGGEVLSVDPARMPGGAPVAAVLRW
ncbi:MAG TPA: hypothetical protein VMS76_08675 [Planctomycetota bacterium]|nr:hypothetical protein [Planctomycetota bacterium]